MTAADPVWFHEGWHGDRVTNRAAPNWSSAICRVQVNPSRFVVGFAVAPVLRSRWSWRCGWSCSGILTPFEFGTRRLTTTIERITVFAS